MNHSVRPFHSTSSGGKLYKKQARLRKVPTIGVATAKLLVRNGSTHNLGSAIVLQLLMGPAARAKIRKFPGFRPMFSKAIHDGIFVLTVPFL